MKRTYRAVLFFYFLGAQSLCLASDSLKTFCSQLLTEVTSVLNEGNRTHFANITSKDNQVIIETPVGRYVFEADPHAKPIKGLPSVSKDSHGKFQVHIAFNPSHADFEKFIQNQVRAAFIADPYLHPHVIPTSVKNQLARMLSYPQKKAVEELLKLEKSQDKREGRWVGLVMPTGLGKTTTSAHFIKQVAHHNQGEQGWKKPPKVLFVVENSLILKDAESTYQKELGLNKIARLYGGENKLSPDTEMIFITRSGYFNKMEDIHKFISKDPDQPWVIVLDEAHHLGTQEGQFEKILDDLQDKHLDHRHVVLTLSATLWHEDKDLIQKYLKGNVYGTFLNDKEQTNLRDGNDLIQITKEQLFRGMEQGYLAPLAGLHIVSEINGISPSLLFSEFRQDVADSIAKQIKDRRLPLTTDRGAVFVTDTRQADKYAKELSTLLGVEVRAFHGKLTETERADTFEWIKDEGKYLSSKEKDKHKYIVVVDLLNEGTDIPQLNLAVTAKTYSHEASGFRALIQNLGRGTRAGKEGIRLIDYSGFSKVLVEGLERIGVRKEDREATNGGGSSGRKGLDLTINGAPIFIHELIELPFFQKSFEDRFPHLNANTFMDENSGAFCELEKASKDLNQKSFATNFGLRDSLIALAEKLKGSRDKEALLKWLRAKEKWTSKDGSRARSQNSKDAQQRAYEGIYKIAEAFNKQDPQNEVDLTKIHEASEFKKLFLALVGEPISKKLEKFADENSGAFSELEKASKDLIQKGFTTDFGLRDALIALAKMLKDNSEKDTLLKWLNAKERGWTSQDASAAKRNIKGAQQRACEAIIEIAKVYNKQEPQNEVDLTKIHEASEFQKLFLALVGEPISKKLEKFVDENSGAFSELKKASKDLNQKRFLKNFGLRDSLIALAEKLKSSSNKEALLKWLSAKERGWSSSDGENVRRNNNKDAQQRAYEAIIEIAKVYNKQEPQNEVDLTKIYEASEFQKLFSALVGEPISKKLEKFMDENSGAFSELEKASKDLIQKGFTKNFGLRDSLITLAEKLKGSSDKEALLKWLNAKERGWSSGDGNRAKRNSKDAQQRAYEGIFKIAEAFNKQNPKTPVDLDKIHEAKEFEKLFKTLLGHH